MSQVDEFGRAIPQVGSVGEGSVSDPLTSGQQHYGGPPHYRGEGRGDRGPTRGGPPPQQRFNSDHNIHHQPYPPSHHNHHHHHHHGGTPQTTPHWRTTATSGRNSSALPPPRQPRRGSGPPPPPPPPPPPLPPPKVQQDSPAAATAVAASARPLSPSLTPSQPLPHPSLRYVAEPMLCGFLWKEEQEKNRQDEPDNADPDLVVDKEELNNNEESTKKPSKEKTYDDYRLDYAWTFLKHFFNQHLDDSWFRQSYSPALKVEAAQMDRRRCHEEAKIFKQEMIKSTDAISLKASSTLSVPSGHFFSTNSRTLHVRNVPPHVTDEHIRQALLPFLTDFIVAQHQEQSKKAGKKSRPEKKLSPAHQEVLEQTIFGVFSSTPHNANTPPANTTALSRTFVRGGSGFLHRSVFCVLASDKIMNGLWQLLSQRDTTAEESNAVSSSGDVHVPRKQEDKTASTSSNTNTLDLEIDCTDPYGRTEYDANGRGGPPPDGLAVPPRKAVVQISRYDAAAATSVLKLSAALSSPTRFKNDQEAAQTMARALDVRQHVAVEDRLDSILEQMNDKSLGLLLDISLAYLRRVHLYSFYKTTKAESFGDMLAGRSVAAQVQLREELSLEGDEDDFKDDLLGQRLNDSIRQTLESDCQAWISLADWFVDEATDIAAREIYDVEERATQEWLHNHFMDDDGRARCSFHFCHKLFKDESFLSKHLLKKHAAYNNAERAKCHDKYMMSTWENAPLRPAVPFILVDCGKQFGKQEAALSGGPEPRATDPEPALWERKQYQEKLLLERQELRAKRPDHALHGAPPPLGARPSKPTFVDVDDMKEEAVVVSFDQVQLPPVGVAKKKKKRKLL